MRHGAGAPARGVARGDDVVIAADALVRDGDVATARVEALSRAVGRLEALCARVEPELPREGDAPRLRFELARWHKDALAGEPVAPARIGVGKTSWGDDAVRIVVPLGALLESMQLLRADTRAAVLRAARAATDDAPLRRTSLDRFATDDAVPPR